MPMDKVRNLQRSSGLHLAQTFGSDQLGICDMARRIAFAAVAAVVLALVLSPAVIHAAFTGGPSVRVSPNSKVEIRWIPDFVGDGILELFDNPNGSETAIDTKRTIAPANDHTLAFNVGGVVAPDSTYYFKITHRDPQGNVPVEQSVDTNPFAFAR
jgi:hypothetical protein